MTILNDHFEDLNDHFLVFFKLFIHPFFNIDYNEVVPVEFELH